MDGWAWAHKSLHQGTGGWQVQVQVEQPFEAQGVEHLQHARGQTGDEQFTLVGGHFVARREAVAARGPPWCAAGRELAVSQMVVQIVATVDRARYLTPI